MVKQIWLHSRSQYTSSLVVISFIDSAVDLCFFTIHLVQFHNVISSCFVPWTLQHILYHRVIQIVKCNFNQGSLIVLVDSKLVSFVSGTSTTLHTRLNWIFNSDNCNMTYNYFYIHILQQHDKCIFSEWHILIIYLIT